jgi:hypothetical protein
MFCEVTWAQYCMISLTHRIKKKFILQKFTTYGDYQKPGKVQGGGIVSCLVGTKLSLGEVRSSGMLFLNRVTLDNSN